MDTNQHELMFDFETLVDLCRQTHESLQLAAARAVDSGLVARNWLFGWYIVEYEQKGADRAEYGERLIARLSAALSASIGKGFSERNLDQFRKFYRLYREIPQTPSAESLRAQVPPDANIYATKYQLYLPSKDELKHQLALAQAHVEDNHERQ